MKIKTCHIFQDFFPKIFFLLFVSFLSFYLSSLNLLEFSLFWGFSKSGINHAILIMSK